MTAPDITLEKAREKIPERVHRASDFLTKEEIEEVHGANIKGKKAPKFDEVDAYVAEIIARFGYETYVAWKGGELDEKAMMRYLLAERNRERRDRFELEKIIVASVAGANNPTEHGTPKSLKTAFKMLKDEEKKIKGGR